MAAVEVGASTSSGAVRCSWRAGTRRYCTAQNASSSHFNGDYSGVAPPWPTAIKTAECSDGTSAVCILAFRRQGSSAEKTPSGTVRNSGLRRPMQQAQLVAIRSEEHTSELQSQSNLVC